MQAGKNAMASAKETASNIAVTAKSGMDKTKAAAQEKVEKLTAHHPAEKEMAVQRKQEKIQQAEICKQAVKEQNAAAKEQTRSGYTGGPVGLATAQNPTGAVPAHPSGYVSSGVVESGPIGTGTGTGKASAAGNPLTGSEHPAVHGTGGGYN